MSEQQSDADKIRNKRLAKLGGSSSTSSSTESKQDVSRSPTTEESPEPSKSKINVTKSNSPQTDTTSQKQPPKINIASTATNNENGTNPFSQLANKPLADGATAQQVGTSRPQSQPRRTSRTGERGGPKSAEDWEDLNLSNLFRITLNPERVKDTHGNSLFLLKDLRGELVDSERPMKLSTSMLDDALLESASTQRPPLNYLLGCWKRITRFTRHFKSKNTDEGKAEVLNEAKRICMSYCSFAATMPDMFYDGDTAPSGNQLADHLLLEPENEKGIDHDFIMEAISRFSEDDALKEAFVGGVEELGRKLGTLSMNDDYKSYVMVLRRLVQYPPLTLALSESSMFLPANTPAPKIEKATLLGPFFRISPVQEEVALKYFFSPKTRDKGNIANSQNALRMTLQTHQHELFEIVDRFIKCGKESRERTLDWFAHCINTNHRKRAMRSDPRQVSTDGFMINITVVLDRLCEPFMDASFSKVGRIEAEYFRRQPRVDIKDETKINADQATADSFYSQKAEGQSNFISEIFFLTVAAHHYGIDAAHQRLEGLKRDIKHFESQLEKFEAERPKYEYNPSALQRFDEALKKQKDMIEKVHCTYYAIEGILLDELSQARSMSFMRYVIVWIIRLVSGVDFPRQNFTLPLPPEQPDIFKCLPQYFVEDIVDHFKFVTSHMPHVISPTQCDELVMVCITFLRSSDYIQNPYVKANLVSILHYGVFPLRNHAKGILGDILNALPFALEYLLHALMQFYIECETTGTHTQFYDKFNIRYEIFQVIKCIWSNPVYRDHLESEANVNLEFFIKFVNLLLNDVTYVLFESLQSFETIASLQTELRANGRDMEETVKTQKEEALDDAQRKAKSYMSLTGESIATLQLFTDSLASQFTTPEVVQRLADMLGYNLELLVGPKQLNLKVENPEQYGFNPARLLSDIMDVYLNLSNKTSFHLAIARDMRSYKPKNFENAARIVGRRGLKGSHELQRWQQLADKVKEAKEAEDIEEEELGDPPQEFMDDLLDIIMEDPVTLPTSRVVLDRSTIRQHLLSDPHDPYNRSPLKIEDVITNDEMREKMLAWKQERKALKAAEKRKEAEEAMDTTP